MLRSFCVGAFVGFLFGSSKQGAQLRDTMDGFLTALLSNDEESGGGERKDAFSERSKSSSKAKSGSEHKGNGNGNGFRGGNGNGGSSRSESSSTEKARGASAVAEREAKGSEPSNATKFGEQGVTLDKAHELQDALNAKPSTPETDELEPS